MSDPLAISFVCTGNICRSPLAEVLARKYVHEAGLETRVVLESFGTHDYHVGGPADHRTIATARSRHVDASAHRARQVTAAHLGQFDMVLAMDSGHERHLRRLASSSSMDNVHLYLPFVGIDNPRDVPDPYYGDAEGFVAVHELLDRAARALVDRLPELLASRHG